MYRRGAAPVIGQTISNVVAPDDWYLKGTDEQAVKDALIGAQVVGTDRVGKLMMLDTSTLTVGLRFGMTGRLVVDGQPVLSELEYSSKRLDPAWDRCIFEFGSGMTLAMNDPRRLGGVELSPDLSKLGPDAWKVGEEQLLRLFEKYSVSAKGLLLNQKRIAGLGNLLVDELLWRSSILPTRSANEVAAEAVRTLAAELKPMLDQLYKRGGSNCGDLFVERNPGGHCPQDGNELSHDTVGGRSTWWCAAHQR